MSTTGIITVRYNSSRLPGKALLELHGKVMLERTYQGLMFSNVDRVVIATTDSSPQIITYCKGMGWDVFADGKIYEDDILSRIIAAIGAGEQIVVRVWGDNPFPFPWLINQAINFSKDHPCYQYVVAHCADSYCSVVNSSTLHKLDKLIESLPDREDIHTWMVDNLPSCVLNYPGLPMKLTVDSPVDLQRLNAVCL